MGTLVFYTATCMWSTLKFVPGNMKLGKWPLFLLKRLHVILIFARQVS